MGHPGSTGTVSAYDSGQPGTGVHAPIYLWRLKNGPVEVEITNYGATIVSIHAPDRSGLKANVVAGFHELASYLQLHPYFGSLVGRFANRIAGGRFELDGVAYKLAANNGGNHLHGGLVGFNRKVWNVEQESADLLQLSYLSPDGEEGYPGNLLTKVTYQLNASGQLMIGYEAETDQATVINLTNHSYFNLTGFARDRILDHRLQLNASAYLLKNERNVPSGQMAPVSDSIMDFRNERTLGDHINELGTDLGYDHTYVIDRRASEGTVLAAILFEPASGRELRVYTDQPGIQLYTSNWWKGELTGYQGKPYVKHGAVALETQGFPDAPNQPGFPSTVLRPGETFRSQTIYQFSTRN